MLLVNNKRIKKAVVDFKACIITKDYMIGGVVV